MFTQPKTASCRELSAEVIAERIAHFGPLASGAHEPNGEACVMEAVAFVAGEPWSDHPQCACPVISIFLRAWNDALPDDERDQLLRPLIPRLINTRGSTALEKRRALMAADWLIRVHTPAWLRLAGLTAHADALSALPEITDMTQMPSIRGPIEAARRDADAAGDAAVATAVAAAVASARTVAVAVAVAVAWAALSTTRREVQQSTLALINRMIDAKEGAYLGNLLPPLPPGRAHVHAEGMSR